jgi:beta-lactamase class A
MDAEKNVAKVDWAGVTEVIAAAERGGSAVGVALVAPSGERFGHNADRRFVAASTAKIPIMVELYRQIDAGGKKLAERYRLRNEDRAPGSGIILNLHDGIEFTLQDLVFLMISISDNTATNVLIDTVGIKEINAGMRRLGMTGSALGRKMGLGRQPGQEENWATPNDYAAVVGAVLDNRAASQEACAQMVAMLEKQQNDRRIARFLPRTDGPRWGSKTGSLPGVVNDAGFVMTDRGPMIICVFTERQPDRHLAEQVIGEISRGALAAVGA